MCLELYNCVAEIMQCAVALRFAMRFTVCDQCDQFKAQLHDPKTPLPEKLGCVQAYRKHLKDQYTDRSLLWQLCDLAYAKEGELMVIWIDGMEQAKFQVPRSRGLKTSSQLCFGSKAEFEFEFEFDFEFELQFEFEVQASET